jgi:chromate transporter
MNGKTEGKGDFLMSRVSMLGKLMLSMMKIGAFTFGGGYAMIGLLEQEFVEKNQWMDHDEFLDLVAIAESTPGPIAINCATYIGYKKERILGSLAATLGMCIPSFAVIFLISLFFNQFLSIGWVADAFRGIQVCVVFLILSAGLKMLKKIKKTAFHVAVLVAVTLSMIAFSLLGIDFSSILYILIAGIVGVMLCTLRDLGSKRNHAGKGDRT